MNQLLFRGKTKYISICGFNRRVLEVNKTFKQAARHLPWLIYWKHKGLKMAMSTQICMTRCISMALEWKICP